VLDELALILLSLFAGGVGTTLYYSWLNNKHDGVEPTYLLGRGDRSAHVHRYDTMDLTTKGKFVCGICRKAPRG
jgi:hypothetical protein